ncbi:hypothetical protein IKG02_00615 [Candidatus Saccharibacteria bacterium]|nr:hypothetical protein [Candidatus Saccharibacteria bacterium]
MFTNENQTPPSAQGGGQPPSGGSGGGSSDNITYSAVTEYSSSASISEEEYSSTVGGENAILVSDGELTLSSPTVTKSGDETSENSDFYGTNAAVLATGGRLVLENASVTTSGAHANAVFAYGSGIIDISESTIKTSGNNSGGIMVTGGGSLTATNLAVETSGNSSAAIRSDRGGGNISVQGGSFSTSGQGSPAIYSTASIRVSGATLKSSSSEGVVVEGANDVYLENSTLSDTNNTLNGNSETYKNIFIYQSMSGDATVGSGSFMAVNSLLETNQGDTFYVTNTTAKIALSGNKIINNDNSGVFLRAESAKWGETGNNGGHVELNFDGQVAEGDIILDNLSSLQFSLMKSSFFKGAINSDNAASNVQMSLEREATVVLTADTYLSELLNDDASNTNIYSNGYKLFVAGSEVEVNTSEAPAVPEVTLASSSETSQIEETAATTTSSASEETNYLPYIVGGSSIIVILLAVLILLIHGRRKRAKLASSDASMPSPASPIQPVPTNPFAPDSSSAPESPSVPESPSAPDSPSARNDSSALDSPSAPESPSTSDSSSTPDNPPAPETPSTPPAP